MSCVLSPEGIVHNMDFLISSSVLDVKRTISRDLSIPFAHVVLRYKGVLCRNHLTLERMHIKPGQPGVAFDLVVDPSQKGEDYKMPNTLFINIYDGE